MEYASSTVVTAAVEKSRACLRNPPFDYASVSILLPYSINTGGAGAGAAVNDSNLLRQPASLSWEPMPLTSTFYCASLPLSHRLVTLAQSYNRSGWNFSPIGKRVGSAGTATTTTARIPLLLHCSDPYHTEMKVEWGWLTEEIQKAGCFTFEKGFRRWLKYGCGPLGTVHREGTLCMGQVTLVYLLHTTITTQSKKSNNSPPLFVVMFAQCLIFHTVST